jgi:CarboxypepD_reg-like domain
MRKILLISVMLIWANAIFAQQKTVRGRVTSSEDGTGLPGVSVIIKGTSKGAITDADGKFSIEAPSTGSLSFSYIGFKSQLVLIEGKSEGNLE